MMDQFSKDIIYKKLPPPYTKTLFVELVRFTPGNPENLISGSMVRNGVHPNGHPPNIGHRPAAAPSPSSTSTSAYESTRSSSVPGHQVPPPPPWVSSNGGTPHSPHPNWNRQLGPQTPPRSYSSWPSSKSPSHPIGLQTPPKPVMVPGPRTPGEPDSMPRSQTPPRYFGAGTSPRRAGPPPPAQLETPPLQTGPPPGMRLETPPPRSRRESIRLPVAPGIPRETPPRRTGPTPGMRHESPPPQTGPPYPVRHETSRYYRPGTPPRPPSPAPPPRKRKYMDDVGSEGPPTADSGPSVPRSPKRRTPPPVPPLSNRSPSLALLLSPTNTRDPPLRRPPSPRPDSDARDRLPLVGAKPSTTPKLPAASTPLTAPKQAAVLQQLPANQSGSEPNWRSSPPVMPSR
jgi:[histone H3]-trimethyl-L-lysine4 demethylase